MKKKYLILLFPLIFSCNKNYEVEMKDILGIYEYTYHDSDPKWDLIKHVITINSDTTYFHKMYHKDALLLEEQGIYNFNRFVPGIKFIEFTAYDKYLEIVPTKKKSCTYLIKRSILGQLYLTFNWGFDPDGEPTSPPKYKKVK